MGIRTYHIIDLPDGQTTDGEVDRRPDPPYFGLEGCPLLKDSSVIDVGAFDGFWAFWAEQAGAGRVVATDVDSMAEYDWGADGFPDEIYGVPFGEIPDHDANFSELKRLLGSKVERLKLNVYDHTPESVGVFDLAICYGLIYHLRHPQLALDRLAKICRGAILVETHTPPVETAIPLLVAYRDGVLADNPANWCGPNEAWVVHALRDAGFGHVFYENPETNRRKKRQRFAGCLDEGWTEHMRANPHFIEADEAYFSRSHEAIAQMLEGGAVWNGAVSQ